MTEILRNCQNITRRHQNDGGMAIRVGNGSSHYFESIVYHTFASDLYAMLYDNSIVRIPPMITSGGVYSRGQVTVHWRTTSSGKPQKVSDKQIAEKYWVIEIPEEVIAEGPYYSPELNATLFLPQHEEAARHPGNARALHDFLSAEVGRRLDRIGHSGFLVNAIDMHERIKTLYTMVHGHVVAIPVRHRNPTKDERVWFRSAPLLREVDAEGESVNPYECIRIIYVLDRKTGAYGRNLIQTVSYSIPKLLKSSQTCWKLDGQWFSSDPTILRRKIAAEAAEACGPLYTREAVDAAVAEATHEMMLELEMSRSDATIAKEKLKRAEAAFHQLRDTPGKIIDGEYDVSHVDYVHSEHLLKRERLDAERATAVATVAKARSVVDKALQDKLSLSYAESQKTKQAFMDVATNVAKFAITLLVFYATMRGIPVKKV